MSNSLVLCTVAKGEIVPEPTEPQQRSREQPKEQRLQYLSNKFFAWGSGPGG